MYEYVSQSTERGRQLFKQEPDIRLVGRVGDHYNTKPWPFKIIQPIEKPTIVERPINYIATVPILCDCGSNRGNEMQDGRVICQACGCLIIGG